MKVVLWKQEALETQEEYRVPMNLSASDALGLSLLFELKP